MNDENIKISLGLLGIYFKRQLIEFDIYYWWQKKYRDIEKQNKTNKQSRLIEINNARDFLENADKERIFNCLKDQGEKTYERSYRNSKDYKKHKSAKKNAELIEQKDSDDRKITYKKNEFIISLISSSISLPIAIWLWSIYPESTWDANRFLSICSILFTLIAYGSVYNFLAMLRDLIKKKITK